MLLSTERLSLYPSQIPSTQSMATVGGCAERLQEKDAIASKVLSALFHWVSLRTWAHSSK